MLAAAALAALAASAAALPAAQRVAMEPDLSHFGATQHWAALRPTTADDTVSVVFHLKHDAATLAKIEETFWAVSNLDSPSYGEHLSQRQIAALGPIEGAAATVTDWLEANGAHASVAATADMIEASMTAPLAEALFATEIHHFQHSTTKHTLNRAVRPYSLPAFVAESVDFVGDLVALPAITTGK